MVFTIFTTDEAERISPDFKHSDGERKDKAPLFIEDVLKTNTLPLVVQVVPSKRNKYFGFDTRPHKLNKLIILNKYSHIELKCASKDGYVQVPAQNTMQVDFTGIKTNKVFPTIRCLCKSKLKYTWFVNEKSFSCANNVYEVGQIFNVQRTPSIKKYFKAHGKGIQVRSYPQGKSLYLPEHVTGNFYICDSPLLKCKQNISDILQSEKVPFMISMSTNAKESDFSHTVEKRLFVTEVTETEILIAIRISRNFKTVHTFPKSLPVEVKVETDDVNKLDIPDLADLKMIEEKLIKSDLDYSLSHHQSCLYEDLGIQSRKRVVSISLEDYTCPSIIEEDFADNVLSQFWESRDDISQLPSEEFFNNTGTLKRVGSFWSITGPKINNNTLRHEPIYEKISNETSIRITFEDTPMEKEEEEVQDPKFLTVLERFALNNKKRCSKLLNLITGRQPYKDMQSTPDLIGDQVMLPRNSCPYLDFHLVNVDQECSNILNELKTYSKSSDNLDVKPTSSSTFDMLRRKFR